jgi:hypothetical protein
LGKNIRGDPYDFFGPSDKMGERFPCSPLIIKPPTSPTTVKSGKNRAFDSFYISWISINSTIELHDFFWNLGGVVHVCIFVRDKKSLNLILADKNTIFVFSNSELYKIQNRHVVKKGQKGDFISHWNYSTIIETGYIRNGSLILLDSQKMVY